MWVPQTRRVSALGLLARSVGTATGPQNWIRLPMQLPLAWWLWREAGAAAANFVRCTFYG